MLYTQKPIKYVRHVDEDNITLEPQRFYVHKFWAGTLNETTVRSHGLDLQDEKDLKIGSVVSNHKVEILMTPETIEPQQVYIGRIKLSFHDVMARPICGGVWDQASYGDASTESFTADTNPITPHLYPDVTDEAVKGSEAANQEIGGSGSGFGISEWKLDDLIHHFIKLKKVTIFDQRPLIGERKQRIPSKVKRINPFTFYGMFFFNDSARGATPADTQVKINIKSSYTEMAL